MATTKSRKKFYGKGIPGIKPEELSGTLIALEGADGVGRSTQMRLLHEWLERQGYPTTEVGLKRSDLVGDEIEEAMKGNTLGPITLSLFYATDFADQLEHAIIPALRAGFVVIADRYIYTSMMRAIVRGTDANWIRDVYDIALVPDLICQLTLSPRELAERNFRKSGRLDYWESGMDISASGDMYECFIKYQTQIRKQFEQMTKEFNFTVIDARPSPEVIHEQVKKEVLRVLKPVGGERGALRNEGLQ